MCSYWVSCFNAGGVTCHRLLSIGRQSAYTLEIISEKQKHLVSTLKNVFALIVDERSMVSAHTLGIMEEYCKQYAMEGKNPNESWGGIPIIIFVGHDFHFHQLVQELFMH